MERFICQTCGTQFPYSDLPPAICPICNDERQYIGRNGQQWTTMTKLHDTGHRNAFFQHEPNLIGINTVPNFAIGQRALLLRTPHGNILWDCLSLCDDMTVELLRGIGGVDAIAISHPHYYSSMVQWAEAFNARIYLHASDKEWVMHPHESIVFWDGDHHVLNQEVTLIRLGGHYDGGTVLHWKDGADGNGVLLSGDIIQVVADKQWVSFMYSYPNLMPLPAYKVQRIADGVSPLQFNRLYGAFADGIVRTGAKEVVLRSAKRYIDILQKTESETS